MSATPAISTDAYKNNTQAVVIANTYVPTPSTAVIPARPSAAATGDPGIQAMPRVQYDSSQTRVYVAGEGPVFQSANITLTDSSLVFADPSAGTFTITMPATPWAGMTVSIKDATFSAATHAIQINANTGQSIENYGGRGTSAAATSIAVNGGAGQWAYDNVRNRWALISQV